MRKLAVLILAAAVTGCGVFPKLHVGAGVSAVVPEESTLENTYQVDLFTRVDVAFLQAEVSVGWKEYEYTQEAGAEEGKLTAVPVAATVRYKAGAGLLQFLVGAGLVWNFNDYSEITGDTLTVENSAGYRALLGLDIKVVEDLKLCLEVQYDFSAADIESALAPGETSSTDGLVARVAFAYNF